MFKDIRFKIFFNIELIMPWLVLICGIPAIYYDNASYKEYMSAGASETYLHLDKMFDTFYYSTMSLGAIIILLELLIGFGAFILMLVNLFKKRKEKYSISRKLVLWICPLFFSIGTLILMLMVHTFTYGMGV